MIMTTEELVDRVKRLSDEERTTVGQFIEFLERPHASAPSSFVSAAEEFMTEHPELLRRLAQ
jgi:hypothetical protein